MLRRRCRQVAGKARLRWVLWPWALTDYYYYCYYCHPRGGSLSVRVSQGPQAHWPVAEAGTGAGGVPGGAEWGGGWGRGGSWWWGRWGERGALDLLRHSVSSINRKDHNHKLKCIYRQYLQVIHYVCLNPLGKPDR